MSALSRSQTPPGGWVFTQPQTGWSAPTPIASTFSQTVELIIRHRMANPAITTKHNLATDVANVGNELESFTKLRLGMKDDPSPKSQPPRSLPRLVAGAVEGLKKVADGAAPLVEWLSSGGQAVLPSLSAARAGICSTCPMNTPGDFTRFFTIPTSEAIRCELSKRNDLKLSTPFDNKLGTCSVCNCPLALKTHTPIDIIAKHLKPERKAELPEWCWIKKETS